MALKPAAAFVFSRTPIVDSTGAATYAFLKQLQVWQTQLANGLSQIGQITQPIPATIAVEGRTEGLGTTLQNIDSAGVILGPGVDFARAYANKDTDHIADGAGHPLAGGKAAEVALVTSPPVPEPSKWVNGLVGGVFTKTQPAFTDIAGAATPPQIPPLSSLSGQITDAQLPTNGISATITTAKLTVGGTNGSMTFTSGLLIAQTPAT